MGDTARAVRLAHIDAYLKDRAEEHAFLESDLGTTFRARGIALEAMTVLSASTSV